MGRLNGYSRLANLWAFFPHRDDLPARLESQPETPVKPHAA